MLHILHITLQHIHIRINKLDNDRSTNLVKTRVYTREKKGQKSGNDGNSNKAKSLDICQDQ